MEIGSWILISLSYDSRVKVSLNLSILVKRRRDEFSDDSSDYLAQIYFREV